MKDTVKVGTIYRLKNGNRAIILHIDFTTNAIIYYDYTLGKNITLHSEIEFIFDGLWDIETDKEKSYCLGVASVITPEIQSNIIGDRLVTNSVSAIERLYEPDDIDTVYIAEHQEFVYKIEFERNANVLKMMKDIGDLLSKCVDDSGANHLVIRHPVEFDIIIDNWIGKRFMILYTTMSLMKKDGNKYEQIRVEWGNMNSACE